jgi:hypothetical protein
VKGSRTIAGQRRRVAIELAVPFFRRRTFVRTFSGIDTAIGLESQREHALEPSHAIEQLLFKRWYAYH